MHLFQEIKMKYLLITTSFLIDFKIILLNQFFLCYSSLMSSLASKDFKNIKFQANSKYPLKSKERKFSCEEMPQSMCDVFFHKTRCMQDRNVA